MAQLSRVNDPQLRQRSAPFSFYLRQETSMTASQRHLSSFLTRLLALVLQQTLECKLEHGDLPQEGKLRVSTRLPQFPYCAYILHSD